MHTHLSLSFQGAPVVEVVLAVCERNHSVRILVQLELYGAMNLQRREAGMDHLGLVLLDTGRGQRGLTVRPHPPVPMATHEKITVRESLCLHENMYVAIYIV